MSYNAFYFTISPEDFEEILDMSIDEATDRFDELKHKGLTTDAFGKGLVEFFQRNEITYSLFLPFDEDSVPKYRDSIELLWRSLGECYIYDVQDVKVIAKELSCMEVETSVPNCYDWNSLVEEFLATEEGQNSHYAPEKNELIGTMLSITKVFESAKEKGHIVINHWG